MQAIASLGLKLVCSYNSKVQLTLSSWEMQALFHQGGKDMSQRDNFASGFFVGAIFGSVVGGVIGALVASGRDSEQAVEEERQMTTNPTEAKKASISKRRQMKAQENEAMSMEMARRSLEDKIAQLNATIDEVRQQLGGVNTNSGQTINENPSLHEELR